MVLIEPSSDYQLEFLDMVLENQNAGVNYGHQKTAQEDFAVYLRKTKDSARGVDLPEGHVSLITFWLVRGDRGILGESHLRHDLTPALEVQGGHIGYNIRPSQRRKGYGTLILALTLEQARKVGLRRIRVTCDTDNIASARIIEKNGGKLSGQAISSWSGKLISQYWIELL